MHACTPRRYALIELGTAWVLLVYLFTTREKMFEVAERIQNSASRRLRTSDFTLEVSQIPEMWSSDRLRAYFERWGEVVHVGVSLNYRELILEIDRTQTLRNYHTDDLLDLATKMEASKVRAADRANLEEMLSRAEESALAAAKAAAAATADGNIDAAKKTGAFLIF